MNVTEAGKEDASAPDGVGWATTEQKKTAERDRVCGQDPLQVVPREVELLPD
jgi:hypothetical protein